MSAEMLSESARPTRKVSKAEWNRPKYNYTRTKSAEEDEVKEDSNIIYTGIGLVCVISGMYYILRNIDTDWDIPVMGGATP